MSSEPTGIFRGVRPLVLASGSPRRAELLSQAGIEFTIRVAHGAEPEPLPGEPARDYALRAARAKAWAVAKGGVEDAAPIDASRPDERAVILAADTIVVLGEPGADERILGKPADTAEALAMLRALSGRWHRVITGCHFLAPSLSGWEEKTLAVETRVRMHAWPDAILRAYAATAEPLDKAGAYAIQGQAACLVAEIQGSYTNVVGLPLAEVVEVLGSWGVIVPTLG